MEKICPNCYAINPADGSFCRACATPIALVQPTYTEQKTAQWQPQNQQWQQPPPYQWQESPPNPQWQQSTPFGGPLQSQAQYSFQAAPSNRPVIALCLVIAGFMCCGPFLTIPGVVLGWMEMNAIKEGRSPQSGLTMAQIAFWGGIVATVLSTLGLIFGILGGILGAFD